MSSISNYLPEWYQSTFNHLSKTPENNLQAIIKALEIIKNGQELNEDRGISNNSFTILKKFAEKIKETKGDIKETIIQDLNEKIKILFKSSTDSEYAEQERTTFGDLSESEDLMHHINSYTGWQEKVEFSVASKNFKTAFDKSEEKQIFSFLKSNTAQNSNSSIVGSIYSFFVNLLPQSSKLPSLNLPKEYSFENIPFEEFQKKLPPIKYKDNGRFEIKKEGNEDIKQKNKKFFEDILRQLFDKSKEIKPNSTEEKLVLYLMKNLKWDVNLVLSKEWPKESNISLISLIANTISNLLLNKEVEESDLETFNIFDYKSAFLSQVNTNDLTEWAADRIKSKNFAYIGNKNIVMPLLQQFYLTEPYRSIFPNLPENLRDDRDIMLMALKFKNGNIDHASARLKDDRDFMLDAVKMRAWAVEEASERLKNDKDFMLAVLEIYDYQWIIERCTSERLKDDKDFMLDAIKMHSWALEYASERLKNDKDFMLAAKIK